MKTINLEYAPAKLLQGKFVGMAVLLLSLGLAAYFAYIYLGLSNRIEESESQLEKTDHTQMEAQRNNQNNLPAIPQPLRSEVDEANRVIGKLKLPWNDLYAAIESTPHAHVAVLSIQPDAEQGSVTISAEAKEANDIASYVYELGESGVLKDAHLVTHQVKIQDPQKPVGFSVTATWIEIAKLSSHADAGNMR